MKQSNHSEQRIKDIIKANGQCEPQQEIIKEQIENRINQKLLEKNLSYRQLLGYLVNPLIGSEAKTLIYDEAIPVLKELMIYFSHIDHLKDFPQKVQQNISTTLYSLFQLLKHMKEQEHLLFLLSDYYNADQRWERLTADQLSNLNDWYCMQEEDPQP